MADRPIIFSAPMVRALLEGSKTQTRRVLKPRGQQREWQADFGVCPSARIVGDAVQFEHPRGGPYTCARLPYAVGDRLWCREAWRTCAERDAVAPLSLPGDTPLLFECDDPERANTLALWGRLRAAMHMPRRYSRLTLTVTDVRVQRLQEISEDDARAEGSHPEFEINAADFIRRKSVDFKAISTHRLGFKHYWQRLYPDGPAAWDANPWCCAVTFTVEALPTDALAELREPVPNVRQARLALCDVE